MFKIFLRHSKTLAQDFRAPANFGHSCSPFKFTASISGIESDSLSSTFLYPVVQINNTGKKNHIVVWFLAGIMLLCTLHAAQAFDPAKKQFSLCKYITMSSKTWITGFSALEMQFSVLNKIPHIFWLATHCCCVTVSPDFILDLIPWCFCGPSSQFTAPLTTDAFHLSMEESSAQSLLTNTAPALALYCGLLGPSWVLLPCPSKYVSAQLAY